MHDRFGFEKLLVLRGGLDAWKAEGLAVEKARLPERLTRGERLYRANCATCHQPNGEGLEGQFPALAGDALVEDPDPRPMAKVVLDGLKGKAIWGVRYEAPMPAFRGKLGDAEIAAIMTYVRSQWGNEAPPVSASDVRRAR